MHLDPRFPAVGLEHDAQLVQGFEQVDAAYRVGPLAVLELYRGDPGERFHQRSQGLEIPVGTQCPRAGQVLVDHRDGAANVADLVGNRATRTREPASNCSRPDSSRSRNCSEASTTSAARRGPMAVW